MNLKLSLITILSMATLATAQAQPAPDALILGAPEQFGFHVSVPVYVADVAGTELGMDQSNRIQAFAMKVSFSSPEFVQAAGFTFSGATASLHPLFKSVARNPASVVVLVSYDQNTNPLVLRGGGQPDLIGTLDFDLNSVTPAGTGFSLTIDPTTAELSDCRGVVFEDVAHHTLALTDTSFTYLPKGDANGDGVVSSSDLFYMISFLFADGPQPVNSGDANQDGRVDPADLFFLLSNLYGS